MDCLAKNKWFFDKTMLVYINFRCQIIFISFGMNILEGPMVIFPFHYFPPIK